MNKRIKHAIAAMVAVGFISIVGMLTNKVNCLDDDIWNALGFDPNATWAYSAPGEFEQRWNNAIQNHPELFVGGGSSSTSQSSATNNTQPASSQNSGKKETKNEKKAAKVKVYFTDMFGKVIGTSQVTFGTTIDTKQFPQNIEDIEHNGNTYQFDKWIYDNKIIEHEYIVRAEYREKK